WSVLTGTSTVTTPTLSTSNVSGLNIGQNNFIWTISNGVCPSSKDTMNVQVDANPSIAVTANNQTLCVSSTTISANNPSIGSGIWSVLTGTSSVASFTVNNTSVSNLNIGQNSFVWTISNGVCASSSDTMSVQVDANPTAAVVGINQLICANTTTISANNPSIGMGNWTVLIGNSNIASSSSNTTAVTNLNVGQNSFVWTISNGVCTSTSDTIIINTDAQPTIANAGADQALCGLTTTSLTANTLLVGNGLWTVLSGTSSVITNTNSTTSITNLNIGLNSFVWSVSNGVCPTSNDTINVHVDALPTIANAGHDTTLYNSMMLLNANTPLVGTGLWSIVSGNGSFNDNAISNTEITGLSNGETIIQWTISNGVCPMSIDELTITIKSFMIPNGFSPNGDGTNDNFEVKGLDEYSNVKLNVFNRWGSTVYKNEDYKNNWNGKNLTGEDLSDDTYFFILEIPDKKTYNGYVVLKRK
ncbi:MAG: gliding motility-associated C-terminal domain-containing protein, partial [Bacteroidia bacterium]